ncbi:MAG: UdgX family uracil-DNA binding protein [Bryobacteraceae bacterium]
MPKVPARSAEPWIPAGANLAQLESAVRNCEGCDLYRHATQAVFGAGRAGARIMMLGEQPGDREDVEGKPFVGPAGKLLDRALNASGIDRTGVYVTNTVKHFKFVERGKRRIHQKPTAPEIAACRPWLEAELSVVRPLVLVCLGATAAQAMLGRNFRITRERGRFVEHPLVRYVTSTAHPSSILRIPEPDRRHEEYRLFVEDLVQVREKLEELQGGRSA